MANQSEWRAGAPLRKRNSLTGCLRPGFRTEGAGSKGRLLWNRRKCFLFLWQAHIKQCKDGAVKRTKGEGRGAQVAGNQPTRLALSQIDAMNCQAVTLFPPKVYPRAAEARLRTGGFFGSQGGESGQPVFRLRRDKVLFLTNSAISHSSCCEKLSPVDGGREIVECTDRSFGRGCFRGNQSP